MRQEVGVNRIRSFRDGTANIWSHYGVWIAFALVVLVGGSNPVAVRFSNLELPPFWGAAVRFGAAALIFWILVASRHIVIPRGRALIGAVLYGLLAVGASYAFLYWGLMRVQANLTMIILPLVPLFTFLLAIAHRLEKFRWRVMTGALIGIAGILVAVGEGLGTAVPLPSLLALIGGAVCLSEGAVVFKYFPQGDLVATNALALTTGTALLFGLSLITNEQWQLPATVNTWAALAYLIFIGSVILFYLYLFVLTRWDASATAYSFLLFPLSTGVIAAWVAGEVITVSFVIGSVLVLAGVWLGGIRRVK
jgi:drug/metabolite transporter (DMT)-like permease